MEQNFSNLQVPNIKDGSNVTDTDLLSASRIVQNTIQLAQRLMHSFSIKMPEYFVSHTIFIKIIPLCPCSAKAVIDNIDNR